VRRKEHRRATVSLFGDDLADETDAVGVEPGGGFVEHEQVGIADECDRECHPLEHARRVLVGGSAGVLGVQPDALDDLVGVVVGAFGLDGGLDVLACAEIRHRVEPLGEQPHTLADGPWVFGHVRPEHGRRPGTGFQKPEQHADRRRLPGTVGAEEAEHLALGDLEGEVVDRRLLAEAFGEALGADGTHRRSPPRTGPFCACSRSTRTRSSPDGPGVGGEPAGLASSIFVFAYLSGLQ
jgi:hypothetical protein